MRGGDFKKMGIVNTYVLWTRVPYMGAAPPSPRSIRVQRIASHALTIFGLTGKKVEIQRF